MATLTFRTMVSHGTIEPIEKVYYDSNLWYNNQNTVRSFICKNNII